MQDDFDTIRNHMEVAVMDQVKQRAEAFPHLRTQGLMADIACVALNRLPPRYIRHQIDFSFYMTEKERSETASAVNEAVEFAVGFVQARAAMRARS
jgi:hypothetical protein